MTAAFKKLSELRHTRAEESETRLKAIADERQTGMFSSFSLRHDDNGLIIDR